MARAALWRVAPAVPCARRGVHLARAAKGIAVKR